LVVTGYSFWPPRRLQSISGYTIRAPLLNRHRNYFHKVLQRPIESAQYTSVAFGKRCGEAGVRPSMGSVGDAYDNAMAESFFSTLEAELLSRRRFASQAEARMACFSYIEGWYNPSRLHSGLGYRSPMTYEAEREDALIKP
jgi:putative transposase